MFDNYSAVNSTVRHSANLIVKLHHRLRICKTDGLEFVNGHRKFGVVHYYRHLQNCLSDRRLVSSLCGQVSLWSEYFAVLNTKNECCA